MDSLQVLIARQLRPSLLDCKSGTRTPTRFTESRTKESEHRRTPDSGVWTEARTIVGFNPEGSPQLSRLGVQDLELWDPAMADRRVSGGACGPRAKSEDTRNNRWTLVDTYIGKALVVVSWSMRRGCQRACERSLSLFGAEDLCNSVSESECAPTFVFHEGLPDLSSCQEVDTLV